MNAIARSITKYIDTHTKPSQVFDFFSNPLNWPQYAVVNLRSIKEGHDGWFKAVTKFGEGGIKMTPVKEFGILDHIWKDPQASWTVYARVIPNNQGSTFMMTFFQPSVLDDHQFDNAMKGMDIEMAKLKEVLEEQSEAKT